MNDVAFLNRVRVGSELDFLAGDVVVVLLLVLVRERLLVLHLGRVV